MDRDDADGRLRLARPVFGPVQSLHQAGQLSHQLRIADDPDGVGCRLHQQMGTARAADNDKVRLGCRSAAARFQARAQQMAQLLLHPRQGDLGHDHGLLSRHEWCGGRWRQSGGRRRCSLCWRKSQFDGDRRMDVGRRQHDHLRSFRIAGQPHLLAVAKAGLEIAENVVQPPRFDSVTLHDSRLRLARRHGNTVDRFQELSSDFVSLRAAAQQNLISPLVQDDLRFRFKIPHQPGQFRLDLRHLLVPQRISAITLAVISHHGWQCGQCKQRGQAGSSRSRNGSMVPMKNLMSKLHGGHPKRVV